MCAVNFICDTRYVFPTKIITYNVVQNRQRRFAYSTVATGHLMSIYDVKDTSPTRFVLLNAGEKNFFWFGSDSEQGR